MPMRFRAFLIIVLGFFSALAQDAHGLAKVWADNAKIEPKNNYLARIVIWPDENDSSLFIEITTSSSDLRILCDTINNSELKSIDNIKLKQVINVKNIKYITKKFESIKFPIIPETDFTLHQDGLYFVSVSKSNRRHFLSGDLSYYYQLEKFIISILPKNLCTNNMKRFIK